MKKSVKVLLIILCVCFAGVFCISGYKLYSILHEYKAAERKYSGLSTEYVSTTHDAVKSGSGTASSGDAGPTVPREVSPIEVDFDGLLATSADVVGWIYSEGTVINYPVVRHSDNDYYLHRYIDGSYNGGGSLFVDYKCSGDFSGWNTLIYGHHMNDGSMFASLSNYRKEGYYEEHPILYLNTPTQNYRVEVFAGFVTDADSDTYTLGFPDKESFQNYLDKMVAQSNFTTDVTVTSEDRIVTLSTCSYEFYDARYVVLGKLVPIA